MSLITIGMLFAVIWVVIIATLGIAIMAIKNWRAFRYGGVRVEFQRRRATWTRT